MKSSYLKSQKRLFIHHSILIQLDVARPGSLPIPTLHTGLTLSGHNISEPDLESELFYLLEKKFIKLHRSPLTPFIKRFRISAKGIEYLQEHNLS